MQKTEIMVYILLGNDNDNNIYNTRCLHMILFFTHIGATCDPAHVDKHDGSQQRSIFPTRIYIYTVPNTQHKKQDSCPSPI